jgi:hypothetical protein
MERFVGLCLPGSPSTKNADVGRLVLIEHDTAEKMKSRLKPPRNRGDYEGKAQIG